MRILRQPSLFVALSLALLSTQGESASRASAQETSRRIAVVVSPSNPQEALTPGQIRRIFLLENSRWPDGRPITTLERPSRTEIRTRFSRGALHLSPREVMEKWLNARLTRGVPQPRLLPSARLVKRYVARDPLAIGYLYEDEVDETVKAVAWIPPRTP